MIDLHRIVGYESGDDVEQGVVLWAGSGSTLDKTSLAEKAGASAGEGADPAKK